MKTPYELKGGTYHQEGDYLIPDLIAPPAPRIGVWGMRRRRFLQQYHGGIYTGLLLSGKLNAHLAEIDCTAEDMFLQLVEQMAKQAGITELLKTDKQLEWIRQMNAIRNQAEGIVFHEIINT